MTLIIGLLILIIIEIFLMVGTIERMYKDWTERWQLFLNYQKAMTDLATVVAQNDEIFYNHAINFMKVYAEEKVKELEETLEEKKNV